jgi:hypothetical protein
MQSQSIKEAFINSDISKIHHERKGSIFEGIRDTLLDSLQEDDRLEFEGTHQQHVRRAEMAAIAKRNGFTPVDSKSIFVGKSSDDNNKYTVLKYLLKYFIPFNNRDIDSKVLDSLVSEFCAGDGYRRMELLGDSLLNAKLVEVCLATYDFDRTVKILPVLRSNAFYDCFVDDLCPHKTSSASDLLEITVGILYSRGYDYSMVALELKSFHEMKGRRRVVLEFNAKAKLWEHVQQRGFCSVNSNFSIDPDTKQFACKTTYSDNKRNYDGYGVSVVKKDAEQKACLEVLRLLFLSGQHLSEDVVQSLGYSKKE